jgi:hypothetical protein
MTHRYRPCAPVASDPAVGTDCPSHSVGGIDRAAWLIPLQATLYVSSVAPSDTNPAAVNTDRRVDGTDAH